MGVTLLTRVLAALLLLLPYAARGQQENIDYRLDDPVELVRQVSQVLFDRLDKNRDIYKQDEAQLEQMIREVFVPLVNETYSARLILGRHRRGLSEAKIKEFADALMNQLIDTYANGLLEFETRDQVQVLPLRGDNTERLTRVRSRVKLDSGDEAPVDYVMHKYNGRWKAFDVIIEGISYVATYRNQFNEEISRDGFDKVLDRLKKGELELEEIDGDD